MTFFRRDVADAGVVGPGEGLDFLSPVEGALPRFVVVDVDAEGGPRVGVCLRGDFGVQSEAVHFCPCILRDECDVPRGALRGLPDQRFAVFPRRRQEDVVVFVVQSSSAVRRREGRQKVWFLEGVRHGLDETRSHKTCRKGRPRVAVEGSEMGFRGVLGEAKGRGVVVEHRRRGPRAIRGRLRGGDVASEFQFTYSRRAGGDFNQDGRAALDHHAPQRRPVQRGRPCCCRRRKERQGVGRVAASHDARRPE
mmetsp:Transcript_1156/g.3935  ORF Transcript_1156/g.3935 Transcript_1156/m.3935 type:complete len:251 (+) Transcript_1156:699-1451(+)